MQSKYKTVVSKEKSCLRPNLLCSFQHLHKTINSLWDGDSIWYHGPHSTLVQVMACCLMAPSHYLDQWWLIISRIQCHSPKSNSTGNTHNAFYKSDVECRNTLSCLDQYTAPNSKWHTHTQTQAKTIPGDQNWPRVKITHLKSKLYYIPEEDDESIMIKSSESYIYITVPLNRKSICKVSSPHKYRA